MLELKNVSYSAGEDDGGVKDILTDVSLCVNERFVAVTGPNGGGKSTLTSPTSASPSARSSASATPSSSRCASRASGSSTCCSWPRAAS